jgi:hypothetical protein
VYGAVSEYRSHADSRAKNELKAFARRGLNGISGISGGALKKSFLFVFHWFICEREVVAYALRV